MSCSSEVYEYVITQGEQGRFFFKPVIDGRLYPENIIDNVELCIDRAVRKTWDCGELFYHRDLQAFSFIFSQEDTLFLQPGVYPSQIRIKLKDLDATGFNSIHIISGPVFRILPSFSKEII